MPKITIQSMAAALGLSRNTVALALKGDAAVSPITRQRVYDYARETGYIKEEGGQHHFMVLKTPDEAPFWNRIVDGIAEEARTNNCIVTVAVVTDEDIAQCRLPIGCREETDVFLFLNVFPEEYCRLLVRDGKIGIFLDGRANGGQTQQIGDLIKSEGIRSMRRITKQLILQGLSRIEFLAGADVAEFETLADRLLGYQEAMEEAGLPMTTLRDLTKNPQSNLYKKEELRKVLSGFPEMPEAFVCCSDALACRVTNELNARNIRVPEDVAVTGFDNDEERSINPFFTTANFNTKWLGQKMVMQAVWRLEHPQAPHETIVVESRVIFRHSSEKYGILQ